MTGGPPPLFTKLLEGANWREVISAVNRANWVVSPNPRSRTKSEKERWVLARFLCARDAQNLLRPPFTIYEGDKPDFWIMTCGRSVGIEVSEIIHEVEAEARTLASDKHLEVHFIPHPREFQTRQSRKDLLQKMKKGDRAWVGSEPADLFAELACSLIVKKSEKHQSYAASDASLLLLYKNTGIPFSEDMFCESGACEKIAACAEAHRGQYERVAIWMGQKLRVF